MVRRFFLVIALVVGVSGIAPAAAVIRPDTDCRNGRVSITFDDGPHRTFTPKLLKVLRANHAQATFFVQGMNAKRYPALLRAEIADGHAVENHSWNHPQLTRLSSDKVSSEIARTTSVIRRTTGIKPRFVRPPYHDTNVRVRKMFKQQRLKQALWTIDTNDWRGVSSATITKAALKGLRKHRSNVILMHDAVGNSPRTVKAVPGIVKGLRKAGYCLVPLQVTAPLSRVSARDMSVNEGTSATTETTVTFALDAPSQRDATLQLYTVDGTAVAGQNYTAVRKTLAIKRGATSVSTVITIIGDPKPSPNKTFTLMLAHAKNVKIGTPKVTVTVTDNSAWAARRGALIAPQ